MAARRQSPLVKMNDSHASSSRAVKGTSEFAGIHFAHNEWQTVWKTESLHSFS
jgi:hypothetical protein